MAFTTPPYIDLRTPSSMADGDNTIIPEPPVARYDLFSTPSTNLFEERMWTEEARTGNVLSDSHVFTFQWNSGMDEWLDLRDQKLYIRYRLYKEDGSAFSAADGQDFILEPNFFHNLWEDVTLMINDCFMCTEVQHYSYLAYIETLLSTTTEQEDELNEKIGWYIPDGEHMDGSTITGKDGTADPNAPALRNKTRSDALSNKAMEMIGTLNLPVFKMTRVLPPGTKIHIDLKRRETSKFFATVKTTHSGGEEEKTGVKVDIEDMYFIVKKRKLFSDDSSNQKSFNTKMLNAISRFKATYPLIRPVLKTFTISAGQRSFSAQQVFTGRTPTKVIVGLVDSDRYHGDKNKTPFAFQHFNVSKMFLIYGQHHYPVNEYQTDFATGKGVLNLWQNSTKNLIFPDDPTFQSVISRLEYSKPNDTGFKTLWVIDLTSNQKHCERSDYYFNPVETKDVGIMVETTVAFPKNLTMITVAYFEDQFQLDAAHKLYKSFP